MVPKRIGFLLFPEIQALDIAGAMDAFEAADAVTCSGRTAPVDWMASSPARGGMTRMCAQRPGPAGPVDQSRDARGGATISPR